MKECREYFVMGVHDDVSENVCDWFFQTSVKHGRLYREATGVVSRQKLRRLSKCLKQSLDNPLNECDKLRESKPFWSAIPGSRDDSHLSVGLNREWRAEYHIWFQSNRGVVDALDLQSFIKSFWTEWLILADALPSIKDFFKEFAVMHGGWTIDRAVVMGTDHTLELATGAIPGKEGDVPFCSPFSYGFKSVRDHGVRSFLDIFKMDWAWAAGIDQGNAILYLAFQLISLVTVEDVIKILKRATAARSVDGLTGLNGLAQDTVTKLIAALRCALNAKVASSKDNKSGGSNPVNDSGNWMEMFVALIYMFEMISKERKDAANAARYHGLRMRITTLFYFLEWATTCRMREYADLSCGTHNLTTTFGLDIANVLWHSDDSSQNETTRHGVPGALTGSEAFSFVEFAKALEIRLTSGANNFGLHPDTSLTVTQIIKAGRTQSAGHGLGQFENLSKGDANDFVELAILATFNAFAKKVPKIPVHSDLDAAET